MKEKHILAHMEAAEVYAQCSSARRLQVGCLIVKDERVISIGYNGMPSGWSNVCEDDNYDSKPQVLHAEANAIAKLARSSESGDGAVAFITHMPCMECSKLIYQSGIIEVYYKHGYRKFDGTRFLLMAGVRVFKIDKEGPTIIEELECDLDIADI